MLEVGTGVLAKTGVVPEDFVAFSVFPFAFFGWLIQPHFVNSSKQAPKYLAVLKLNNFRAHRTYDQQISGNICLHNN